MTKVTILGENNTPTKKKPITFNSHLMADMSTNNQKGMRPIDWRNIELICKNYRSSGLDLMFAYEDDRNKGTLYVGHFNDGVVE